MVGEDKEMTLIDADNPAPMEFHQLVSLRRGCLRRILCVNDHR